MTRKHFIYILLIVSILVTGGPGSSHGFRCDTKVISVGDTKSRVVDACGYPTSITILLEGMTAWDYGSSPYTGQGNMDYGMPQPDRKPVTVEEWTYNRGSTQFVRYLQFEDEILKRIITGKRGN